jgi:hypothetical protein
MNEIAEVGFRNLLQLAATPAPAPAQIQHIHPRDCSHYSPSLQERRLLNMKPWLSYVDLHNLVLGAVNDKAGTASTMEEGLPVNTRRGFAKREMP